MTREGLQTEARKFDVDGFPIGFEVETVEHKPVYGGLVTLVRHDTRWGVYVDLEGCCPKINWYDDEGGARGEFRSYVKQRDSQ